MSKTKVYVRSLEPFTICIKKNKRAVSIAVAERRIEKEFPDAPEGGWKFYQFSHGTIVYRIDDWIPSDASKWKGKE